MNRWVNVFPLIQDKRISGDEIAEVISAWIPSEKIQSVDLIRNKQNGKYWVRLELIDTEIREEFESYELAIVCWKNLEGALGIKSKKKRGPKRKYFEVLKIEELDEVAGTTQD